MTKHASNGKTPIKIPDKGRAQRDATAEEIARANAERLLTPAAPQAVMAPAVASEPSLEQRLADIDRRAKENAVREKSALAAHYLMEARNAFKRAISRTTDEAVKLAYENVQRLERMVDNGNGTVVAPVADTGGRTTRERRSPESLRADAQKLADWLRDHPSSKGSAAAEATGVVVKPPLNVRTFIEKYLPGTRVKTEGQKAGTLYSIH